MNNHFSLNALTTPIDSIEGLRHAVLQSIYNCAPSTQNDKARMLSNERGGCWSDDYVLNVGSRHWTLKREKLTEQTTKRMKKIYLDALRWLVEQKHVKHIDVTIQKYDTNRVERHIIITLKNNTQSTIEL